VTRKKFEEKYNYRCGYVSKGYHYDCLTCGASMSEEAPHEGMDDILHCSEMERPDDVVGVNNVCDIGAGEDYDQDAYILS
jgi:hypothetical protein